MNGTTLKAYFERKPTDNADRTRRTSFSASVKPFYNSHHSGGETGFKTCVHCKLGLQLFHFSLYNIHTQRDRPRIGWKR